ncbi:hypothetical protein CJ030_MR3G001210 [Morella rubra]|uniref:Uncharacterized protein n=1 Tax=Morella rubra TaxID=262757 RepID=A0A6A1W5D3_9ROSI|nr:hypothetical protein CJ030_MR3G001210 [Morella rubra]
MKGLYLHEWWMAFPISHPLGINPQQIHPERGVGRGNEAMPNHGIASHSELVLPKLVNLLTVQ